MYKKIMTMITCFTLFLVMASHLPSAYAKTHHRKHHKKIHRVYRMCPKIPSAVVATRNDSKQLAMNPKVWQLALKAYNKAIEKGLVRQKVLTVIDYSLPSTQKRLWVVDLQRKKILLHTLVAHGKRTGGLFARHFSNRPGSLTSSIGTFVTENTYCGSHGYSLRLRGLEPGFNERAKSRAIVIHGAWYASQDFARRNGRLGLSWGCPAVSAHEIVPLINRIKGGSIIFAYYPDPSWLKSSKFLT